MRQLRHREVKWLETKLSGSHQVTSLSSYSWKPGSSNGFQTLWEGCFPMSCCFSHLCPHQLSQQSLCSSPSTPVNAPRMTPENWPSKMKCMFDQYPDNITMEGGEGKLTIWHTLIPRPFKLPVPRWSTSGEQGAIRSSIWWKCWFQK